MEHALIIDAGNTRIKVGVFVGNEVKSVHVFLDNELVELKKFIHDFKNAPSIIASVRSEKNTKWLYSLLPRAIRFNQQSPFPIQIDYETPLTLGIDRIANAIAVSKNKTALVIDLGTCIKFDFVQNNCFMGGSISPGIKLRFRALHEFTGKLPLIQDFNKVNVIAKNTSDALRSGVLIGIEKEICGFIDEYRLKYPELTIFMTGGDAIHFDFDRKYGIFVDENLTLKGLNNALKYVQTHLPSTN